VLLPGDLHVDVLVVVLVQGGHGARVADPEVDGVRVAGEGQAGPGDGARDVGKEGGVLVAEVVVLGLGVADFLLVLVLLLLLVVVVFGLRWGLLLEFLGGEVGEEGAKGLGLFVGFGEDEGGGVGGG